MERDKEGSHKMPSLLAINVCIVSPTFDAAAIPLSWSICPTEGYGAMRWDAEKSYRLRGLKEKALQRGYGHPHCTVAQLCIQSSSLDALRDVVREHWLAMKSVTESCDATLSLTALEDGAVFSTTTDGAKVYLPNIKIECCETLRALHTRIVHAVRPFHVHPDTLEMGRTAFHPSFPVDNATTVEWMEKYLTDYCLEAYNPHITLGATTVKASTSSLFKPINVPWRESRLVVSQMAKRQYQLYGICDFTPANRRFQLQCAEHIC